MSLFLHRFLESRLITSCHRALFKVQSIILINDSFFVVIPRNYWNNIVIRCVLFIFSSFYDVYLPVLGRECDQSHMIRISHIILSKVIWLSYWCCVVLHKYYLMKSSSIVFEEEFKTFVVVTRNDCLYECVLWMTWNGDDWCFLHRPSSTQPTYTHDQDCQTWYKGLL